jgi:hypothetical protein
MRTHTARQDPSPSWDDLRLQGHRVAQTAKHTAGLKPGWYILTGFFWHDACTVVEGPFTTQDDAVLCRSAIEAREGHHQYYIDEVEPA